MESRQTILEELRREVEYYSLHTKSQYVSHVSDYLDYIESIHGDWKDRDNLYNYLQKLKKKGFSQSHINYIIRGPIGSIFRAHGLRIPIKLPRVIIRMSMADLLDMVQFSSEEIEAFIKAARKGTAQEKAVFAIATVYGPRIGEIQTIRPEDVHSKKKTLVIHTEKNGYPREHQVPPEIQPYVFGYNYSPLSHNQLYQLFDRVCARAGIERKPRKVFHAIRHGVAAGLRYEGGLDKDIVHKFLRWKGEDIVDVYAPYDPKNDQTVFAKHPFLSYWK